MIPLVTRIIGFNDICQLLICCVCFDLNCACYFTNYLNFLPIPWGDFCFVVHHVVVRFFNKLRVLCLLLIGILT
jgi:hypothetical protein